MINLINQGLIRNHGYYGQVQIIMHRACQTQSAEKEIEQQFGCRYPLRTAVIDSTYNLLMGTA